MITVRGEKGFTLLELLAVIVIISILFTFSVLAIRGVSPEEQIIEEAQRLNRLMQLALDEAVMRNVEYGLFFKHDSYQFVAFDGTQWRPVDADKQLRKRELPGDMEIELEIEQIEIIISDTDDDKQEEKLKPQVFLLSSEEITPEFTARFTVPGVETSYLVQGYIDGKHTVSKSDF